MEIHTDLSVGMGWVWELKSISHGSPVKKSGQRLKSLDIRNLKNRHNGKV